MKKIDNLPEMWLIRQDFQDRDVDLIVESQVFIKR